MEMLIPLALAAAFGISGAIGLAWSSDSRRAIKTDKAPVPIGPYSQAIKCGNLLFVSGQLGFDNESKKLHESVMDQTSAALGNISNILEAGGGRMNCVVKTTIFLADMNDFPAVNEVYATFFPSDPPARSTVQAAKLPLGALVEIEAVAWIA